MTFEDVESAIIKAGPGSEWIGADGIESATVFSIEERAGGYVVVWQRVVPHAGVQVAGNNTCPIRTVAWWVMVNKATVKDT